MAFVKEQSGVLGTALGVEVVNEVMGATAQRTGHWIQEDSADNIINTARVYYQLNSDKIQDTLIKQSTY